MELRAKAKRCVHGSMKVASQVDSVVKAAFGTRLQWEGF